MKKKKRQYNTSRGVVHRETVKPDSTKFEKYQHEREFNVKEFIQETDDG